MCFSSIACHLFTYFFSDSFLSLLSVFSSASLFLSFSWTGGIEDCLEDCCLKASGEPVETFAGCSVCGRIGGSGIVFLYMQIM